MRKNVEFGQSLPEYAFLIAFIAIVLIVIIVVFGEEIAAAYQNVMSNF